MNTITPQNHNVLQMHGGGSLTTSALIKCAILEKITGRRIPELFQTTICDSGGAVARLGFELKTAEEALLAFIGVTKDTFPERSFYYTQLFQKLPRRFNNAGFRELVDNILGDSTLSDVTGNIFISACHHHGEGGTVIFEKYKHPSHDTPTYINAQSWTRLSRLAIRTSTIPGVFDESDEAEESDEIYLDAITNQNPAAILAQIKDDYKGRNIFYLQLGNIQDQGIVQTLRKKPALFSRIFNLHAKYALHLTHSNHKNDAERTVGRDNVISLITYGHGKFSPTDPTPEHSNRVIIETLSDIERRAEEYEKIAQHLTGGDHLSMSVADAIRDIQKSVSPLMKRRTVHLRHGETPPDEFPAPRINWVDDQPSYKRGHSFGKWFYRHAPKLGGYIVKSDFDLVAATQLATESGLRKLLPDTARDIEPK